MTGPIQYWTPVLHRAILMGMNDTLCVQGRELSCDDIERIRQLIRGNPHWSRRALSIALSEHWDWTNAAGQLKDMACRSMLLKLHERGHIVLPARRQTPTNRMVQRKVDDVAHDTAPIEDALSALRPLRLINVSEAPECEPLYRCLLARYHYLGYKSPIGENQKYLVLDPLGRPLGCVLFGSSAWSCADRDAYVGWGRESRARNLQFTTNNTRFLILPWVKVPHLASHILSQVSRRVAPDWQRRYGHPVYLLETFVDTARFKGTCYRAANWQAVGVTRGRSRNDRYTRLRVSPKSIWLYPLIRDFHDKLNA